MQNGNGKLMQRGRELSKKCVWLAFVLAISASLALSQQSTATLRGRVMDERGDALAGASVRVVDAGGAEKTALTDEQGKFVVTGLAAGKCKVKVEASGFAAYENDEVSVSTARAEQLLVWLKIFIKEEMNVESENGLDAAMGSDGGQFVLDASLLDALPDDPELLASALAAVAGAPAGSGGTQTLVDGFTAGRLPPKDLIREIRINRNPFSAEYDQPGFLAIEVFTKPGTEKLHGQAFTNFSHNSLNSRNPFAPHRLPFQSGLYGASLGGPLIANRMSWFVSYERGIVTDGLVISSTSLDQSLNIVPFKQVVQTPRDYTTFSPRFDYLMGANSVLSARYIYAGSSLENAGLTAFSLPSTAFDTSSDEHALELTYLRAFSKTLFNDSRLRLARTGRRNQGDSSLPTINVLEAFIGGGAQDGSSFNNESRWEFVNNTSWSRGAHSFRSGGRLRGVRITDFSPSNFSGTYIFAGGLAPALDRRDRALLDSSARPVLEPITSIERYRRTLLFQRQGLTTEMIRRLGGGPAQLSIATGDPQARVNQMDLGVYLLDEWRLRPNVTLSLGLRYETQTNIGVGSSFAPRLGLVWSPDASSKGGAKTVIRVGFGIFYDRVGESIFLQAKRFDGVSEHQYIVSDKSAIGARLLDSFPQVPAVASIESLAEAQTIWRTEERIQSPSTILWGINFERVLPFKIALVATYSNRHRLHGLVSRNINAPGPDGRPPLEGFGNIFEFESNALFNQHQVAIQARYAKKAVSLFASYYWAKAESNSDGPLTFPANSYDTSLEYGRAAFDIRHSFSLMGNINLPWGIALSPLITARSGIPFNIITGIDANNDGVFTERPALATDLDKPGVKSTGFGLLDPHPLPGQATIPRNFGSGPGFFQINLRLSKAFSFGRKTGAREGARYKLTLSIQAQNLTNRTNLGPVVGNLSSPLFGQSNSILGGSGFGLSSNPSYSRRIEAQVRYSF